MDEWEQKENRNQASENDSAWVVPSVTQSGVVTFSEAFFSKVRRCRVVRLHPWTICGRSDLGISLLAWSFALLDLKIGHCLRCQENRITSMR